MDQKLSPMNNCMKSYQDKKPELNLLEFFQGRIEGWGSLFDWQGRATRRFSVLIEGKWQGQDGELQEWFVFEDGEKTERTWKIHFSDDHHFTGVAHDVIDQAIGQQLGNATNIRYKLRVPYKKSAIDLRMDDWMYLLDENTILNRTKMKKFGLKVGEIVLLMKRKP